MRLMIVSLIFALGVISCDDQNFDELDNNPGKGEVFTVKLGFEGVDVDESVLPSVKLYGEGESTFSTTSSSTLPALGQKVYYGVSILENGQPYAHAVFDYNPADIRIDLTTGNDYIFEATAITDGRGDNGDNPTPFNGSAEDRVTYPFSSSFLSIVKNEIIYSDQLVDFSHSVGSFIATPDYTSTDFDRYHTVESFESVSIMEAIDLELLPMIYGVSFVVDNAKEEHSYFISIESAITDKSYEVSDSSFFAYTMDDLSVNKTEARIRIWFESEGNTGIELYNEVLEFNRNTMKTFRLDANDIEAGIMNIILTDEEMINTDVIHVIGKSDPKPLEIEGFSYAGTFEGHDYYKSSEQVNYKEAAHFAWNLGGYLATVSSEEENSFLKQIGEEWGVNIFYLGYDNQAWNTVGIGPFKWHGQEGSSYTNWDKTYTFSTYGLCVFNVSTGQWRKGGSAASSNPSFSDGPLDVIIEIPAS